MTTLLRYGRYQYKKVDNGLSIKYIIKTKNVYSKNTIFKINFFGSFCFNCILSYLKENLMAFIHFVLILACQSREKLL